MLFGPQPDRSTWAIALVHGIGTTKPLDMITEVSKAIKGARPDFELSDKAEIYEVAESENGPPRYVHVRNGTIHGGKVRIGTAHWADVSYYREGIISLIGILLMAAFGVRFFANVATEHRHGTPMIMRAFSGIVKWLLYLMVVTLAVFVFPVTFVSLIYSSIGLLAEYTIRFWGHCTAPLQAVMIAGAGFTATATLAHIGMSRISGMHNERSLGRWIFGSMVLVAALLSGGIIASVSEQSIPACYEKGFTITPERAPEAAANPAETFPVVSARIKQVMMAFAERYIQDNHLNARIAIADPIGVYFASATVLQIFLGIVMLALATAVAVGLLLYYVVVKVLGRSANTMIFAVVSVVSIWIAMSLLLWPENLANHSAQARFVDQAEADRIGCVEVDVLKAWNDPSASGRLDWAWNERDRKSLLIGKENIKSGQCPSVCPGNAACAPVFKKGEVPRTLGDTYPVSWFESAYLVFLLACLFVFTAIFLARKAWLSTRSTENLDGYAPTAGAQLPRQANWPRLIVSALYTAVVVIFLFGVSTYFLVRVIDVNFPQVLPTVVGWFGAHMPAGEKSTHHEVTIGAEFVRLAVILFVAGFVLFSTYMANGLKLVLDVVNHFTQPNKHYPVRKRIAKRFDEMVELLLAPSQNPHLLIIAHSQGTVITIDALMDEERLKSILDRVSSLTIITCGSPLTHVYQRYFPREYPELASIPDPGSTHQSKATDLKKLSEDPRVRWINAYRIDDYVGTYIENSIPNFPINVPLPTGGHLRYWEADVMNRIFERPEIKDVLLKNAQA